MADDKPDSSNLPNEGHAIVPRWEWRTFGELSGNLGASLASHTPVARRESEEPYVLSRNSDASVKIRDGVMDVKQLVRVGVDGLEQWKPTIKAAFPLPAAQVSATMEALGVPALSLARGAYSVSEFLREVVDPNEDLLAIDVHKRRTHYDLGRCRAELSEVRTTHRSRLTVAVESEDPGSVLEAVRELGFDLAPNVNLQRELKTLAGFGTHRYAVIDVGSNSVKFLVGELEAAGGWRRIVDRADVTRLGEGMAETRELGEKPIERTVATIEAMADEARREGAERIVVVGTAALRLARNSATLVDAARDRAGVEVEIIDGEQEARLAYVAATSGLGLSGGSQVVFDTGGGSSQFSFGRGDQVAERFSVPVGAVRFTERFGLDGAVDDDTLAAALDAIAADLAILDGRSAPDTVIGMGGTVTNMVAVQHRMAPYDPVAVHGAVLDVVEIDRQIERYRTSSSEARSELVGLQPNRAAVILAGACVLRTVLSMLGRDSLTVSERGLRHGALVERCIPSAPSERQHQTWH